MKRLPLLLAVFTLCVGCRASLEVQVDVYRGPTADTTQEPSLDRILSIASQIAAAGEAAAHDVSAQANSAISDTRNIASALSAGDAASAALSKKPELAEKAQAYLAVYKQGLTDLKAALGTAAAEDKKTQIKSALDKLARTASPFAATRDDAAVSALFAARFESWGGKAVSNPKAVALLAQLIGASECTVADPKCPERRTKAEKQLSQNAELVSKLADAMPEDLASIDMTVKGTSPELTAAKNVEDALTAIRDSSVKGGIAEALVAVHTAVDKLQLKATTLRGQELKVPPRQQLAPELAELQHATQAVRGGVEDVKPGWDEALNSVEILRRQLQAGGVGGAKGTTAPIVTTGVSETLASFQAKVLKISAGLLALDDQDAEQALAPRPFRTTDPNLKALADPDNDHYWEGKPLDKLDVTADGNSQFVVVQETPVNFKLKRLHADPSKSAELAMSVAEVGFNVLSTVVLNGAELPGSAPGGAGSSDASASAGKDDAATQQATIAAMAACKSGVRDLVSKLRAELSILKAAAPATGAPKDKKPKADVDQAARIQGIIHGQIALLKSCAAELNRASAGQQSDEKASDTAPATEPANPK